MSLLTVLFVLQKLADEEVPETEDDKGFQSETTGNVISRLVEKVLNVPGISLLKPSLASLIPVLAGSLLTALAVVGIPLALLLALLFSTLFGGKKASSVVCPCIAGEAYLADCQVHEQWGALAMSPAYASGLLTLCCSCLCRCLRRRRRRPQL